MMRYDTVVATCRINIPTASHNRGMNVVYSLVKRKYGSFDLETESNGVEQVIPRDEPFLL